MKFSKAAIYNINLIWGFIDISLSVLGLYFIYRWALTILATDDEVRNILIGESFYKWFKEGLGDDLIIYFASFYIGFKFTYLIISTIQWEIYMEKTKEQILN